MIRFLKGKLFKKDDQKIVVLTQGVGYEVFVPFIVAQDLESKKTGEEGDEIELCISYYHGQRQLRPMLVGFFTEAEREFFELFITVGDIGPTKAVRLISRPIHEIARAIEERDARSLTQIKGLGAKLADKIIAQLYGKVGKYALIREQGAQRKEEEKEDIAQQVLSVMVKQLGYKRNEAMALLHAALERTPHAGTPEELFEEVYRSQRMTKNDG
jgi:Holliday junction DNA helicase RuvA